jgi:hypothetical protein
VSELEQECRSLEKDGGSYGEAVGATTTEPELQESQSEQHIKHNELKAAHKADRKEYSRSNSHETTATEHTQLAQ